MQDKIQAWAVKIGPLAPWCALFATAIDYSRWCPGLHVMQVAVESIRRRNSTAYLLQT